MSKTKSSMDKVSGRVDGSSVQPQELRQNQHSAALKQRQRKILEVLPRGAVKGESAKWYETPASKFTGKKSIVGQFSNVFVCALWSVPFGVGGFLKFSGSIFIKWRICWELMRHQENCYRASIKLSGFFLLYGQSLPSG